MDENIFEITRDNDDNARDEFSAAYFFKNQTKNQNPCTEDGLFKNNPIVLGDVTNKLLTSNSNAIISTKVSLKQNNEKGIVLNKLMKSSKSIDHENEQTEFDERKYSFRNMDWGNKAKKKRLACDNMIENNDPEFDTENIVHGNFIDHPFDSYKRKRHINHETDEDCDGVLLMDLKCFDETSIAIFISQALENPAYGYNSFYQKYIVVPEPSVKSAFIKINENSTLWKTMMDTCKIDRKISLVSPRKWCSPPEQFTVSHNNQYESKCLINTYFSNNDASFLNAFALNKMNRFYRRFTNQSSMVIDSLNTSYFHELFMEKLICNQSFDFIPTCRKLTGCILGGFINQLFQLSNVRFIPNEVLHYAVDLIYHYLSRVRDIHLTDLRWICLGAIWVAGKFNGYSVYDIISHYVGCTLHHLRKAELRLIVVIDFNVMKPNALNFRNRYLMIEHPNSTILHLSSFILDMSLHCYTLMLIPASKRAAAAMFLSRLIDKFDGVRFNEELWSNMEIAQETMDSVWPNHLEKLSGYSHREISQLALKMHVIIIAFISNGKPKYSSVVACHNKYSSSKYGELTQSYEKFTARTVFFASELYCRLNQLELSNWLEDNEFETLLGNYYEHKVQLRRSQSSVEPEFQVPKSSNSCPELLMKPIIASRPIEREGNQADNNNKKNLKLVKFDSGYSTSSSTMGNS